MDLFHFTDSDPSENSDNEFTGFNSRDVQAALQKRNEQNTGTISSDESSLSSSDSDDAFHTYNDSFGSETNESDVDVDNVDPSFVPDLLAIPIEWTEDLRTIHVPAFKYKFGP